MNYGEGCDSQTESVPQICSRCEQLAMENEELRERLKLASVLREKEVAVREGQFMERIESLTHRVSEIEKALSQPVMHLHSQTLVDELATTFSEALAARRR